MSNHGSIQVCTEGQETTVSFQSRDLNRVDSMRKVSNDVCDLIDRAANEMEPIEHLNIDFAQIERISSAGLNGLIQMNSKSRSHGVRLVLVNVSDTVREVFEITRLERMFDFGGEAQPIAMV